MRDNLTSVTTIFSFCELMSVWLQQAYVCTVKLLNCLCLLDIPPPHLCDNTKEKLLKPSKGNEHKNKSISEKCKISLVVPPPFSNNSFVYRHFSLHN